MLFQPPFEPTEVEAIAILNIGFMFADIIIMLILIVLMIYSYKKLEPLISIVVYLFSLLVGFQALEHIHTHFSPTLEIFFILFQTSVFIMGAINFHKS